MRTLGLSGWPFGMALAIAFLAGCEGAQTTAQIALPLNNATTALAKSHGHSWMLTEAQSGALIYATGGCGGTCVISYSDGALVGSLGTGTPNRSGACSDAKGNVFIAGGSTVTEFAHGGTSPINTLNLPGDEALGCSVDPISGNLAVVFESDNGDIAIFQNEQGTPSVYQSQLVSFYCGYDASGDLFVDGRNSNQSVDLSELPKGSSSFTRLTIDGTLGDPPAQVQWDGHYMTYQSIDQGRARIVSLSIAGSTATIVHTTRLKRITSRSSQSWIYEGTVVVPYATKGTKLLNKLGIWKYPAGGKPKQKYTGFPNNPDFQAVTVSG